MIGAKGLLTGGENRYKNLGTLAHELCHYAMQLIYNNNCNPYRKSEEPHLEFDNIVKLCEGRKHEDDIIKFVFNYPPNQQHSEMITRVVHLLALHKTNQGKLTVLRETFAELFSFYESKTLVELMLKYSNVEGRQKVEKLNKLNGLLDEMKLSRIFFNPDALSLQLDLKRVSFIKSNCSQLTVNLIHQQISDEENFSSQIFLKLEALKIASVFNLIGKAFTSSVRPTVVVDCREAKAVEIEQA